MEPTWKNKKDVEILYDKEKDVFHVRDRGEYVIVDLKNLPPKSRYASAMFQDMFGEAMLRSDIRSQEKPQQYQRQLGILFEGQLKKRQQREKHGKNGVVDDTITQAGSPDGQRIYNRSHPEGRRVNSDEQRREHGASFYGG